MHFTIVKLLNPFPVELRWRGRPLQAQFIFHYESICCLKVGKPKTHPGEINIIFSILSTWLGGDGGGPIGISLGLFRQVSRHNIVLPYFDVVKTLNIHYKI